MTADEWNLCHPAQASAYVEAWTNRQKREDTHRAILQLTIASWSGNVKKGHALKLDDFLPSYCQSPKRETTPEEIEMMFSDFLSDPKS